MMMEIYIQVLQEHALAQEPDFGDGESILTLLYEVYSELNRMDNDQIKADFKELYKVMNGMKLQDMDQVVYPVCLLCRDHERAGFLEGVKVGIRLKQKLSK